MLYLCKIMHLCVRTPPADERGAAELCSGRSSFPCALWGNRISNDLWYSISADGAFFGCFICLCQNAFQIESGTTKRGTTMDRFASAFYAAIVTFRPCSYLVVNRSESTRGVVRAFEYQFVSSATDWRLSPRYRCLQPMVKS